MNKIFQSPDERTQALSGNIATIILALTQTALLGSILYRRFALGMDEAYYRDIKIILLASVFSFIAARLYFGAVLPVISFRILVRVYVISVVLLFMVLSLWLGWPNLSDWQNTILPVVLGPAILLGLYAGLAYLGEKRIEKLVSKE